MDRFNTLENLDQLVAKKKLTADKGGDTGRIKKSTTRGREDADFVVRRRKEVTEASIFQATGGYANPMSSGDEHLFIPYAHARPKRATRSACIHLVPVWTGVIRASDLPGTYELRSLSKQFGKVR